MTRFDLTPRHRSSTGFDHFAPRFHALHALHALQEGDKKPSFPPYNVERMGELEYRVSMAVAGFKQADIQLEQRGETLTVSGTKQPPAAKTASDPQDPTEVLYRGFENLDFERRFQLAADVKVIEANLVDGILNIDLQRQIPEAEKPRKININQPS
jgi:molecular chaperone IbpA